jgi:hypothetical protein
MRRRLIDAKRSLISLKELLIDLAHRPKERQESRNGKEAPNLQRGLPLLTVRVSVTSLETASYLPYQRLRTRADDWPKSLKQSFSE